MADWWLTPFDLPGEWRFGTIMAEDKTHQSAVGIVMKLKEDPGQFAVQGQRIEDDQGGCNFYVFVYTDDTMRRRIRGTLDANTEDFNFRFFEVGDAVIQVFLQDDEVIPVFKTMVNRRFA
ncbi:MAG: hypothetical protein ACYS47_16310, partial [Planctomycetota bacterium]